MSEGIVIGAEGHGGDEDAEPEGPGEDESLDIEPEEIIVPKPGKRKKIDLELDVVDKKPFAKRVSSQVFVDEKKPTTPRAGKSIPAEPTVRKKARTGIDRFADIAACEEETTQKALELKKTKFQGETEKAVARVRVQAEIQMNKDKLQMEYAQKKLEYKFKLQLQAMQRPQTMGGKVILRLQPTSIQQRKCQFSSPISHHFQDIKMYLDFLLVITTHTQAHLKLVVQGHSGSTTWHRHPLRDPLSHSHLSAFHLHPSLSPPAHILAHIPDGSQLQLMTSGPQSLKVSLSSSTQMMMKICIRIIITVTVTYY